MHPLHSILIVMKLGRTARQSIVAFLFFLVMAGVYGALIVVCNQMLRHYGLHSQFTKVSLVVVTVIGFYLIFRWFCRRLNTIVKN